jgi:hypothetical protein
MLDFQNIKKTLVRIKIKKLRSFNDREKQIIRNISELDINNMTTTERFLQDTFFSTENKRALIVKHDQKAILYYTEPKVWANITLVRIAMMELFEIISLLRYLKEQRYLDIFTTPIPTTTVTGIHSSFNKTEKIKPEPGKFFLNDEGDYFLPNDPDKIINSQNQIILRGGLLSDYYNIVYENCIGLFFPNEALYNLVENDFKTPEEIKHRQNIRLSRSAIIVAICLGAVGIIMPLMDDDKLIKETNTILNSNNNQQNEVIEILELNSSYLSDISLFQQKNDTIKKEVKKK